jgi:Zn-dependent peptidase ImmA (M78 family)
MTARKTKRQIPFDRTKIGYVDADVNLVETREIEKRDNIYGEWFAKHHEIDVDKNMVDGELINTFTHEVLHALVHVWGIKFESHEQEEYIVNALGGALTTYFKDNADYLQWLLDTFHGDE